MKTVQHMFMPQETIIGAIKHYNNYQVSKEDVETLMHEFNNLNNARIPKPGEVFLIPLKDK